mmetsp:Transcript_2232/g.7977  ORF Transcript_2232/g.7977 Transcript_2232/m.7977 type:complete len:93 (-) Transcript_2232:402-680(-)
MAIAVGKSRGHTVTKRETKKARGTALSERDAFVKSLVKEVVGLAPYEKRIVELLKIGREKRALKYAKKKLGSHTRGKKKREEMQGVLRKAKK